MYFLFGSILAVWLDEIYAFCDACRLMLDLEFLLYDQKAGDIPFAKNHTQRSGVGLTMDLTTHFFGFWLNFM
jgi:hypothetical protein